MTAPQPHPRAGSQFATLRDDVSFDETNRYWNDPAYRARCNAEAAHQQALNNSVTKDSSNACE